MAEKDSQSNPQEQQPKRKFSQEQYDLLKRCSEKKDMTEWNEWRKKNSHEEIFLQNANLLRARGAQVSHWRDRRCPDLRPCVDGGGNCVACRQDQTV